MLYWISLVKVICKNTAGVSLQYRSIKSWSERRLGPQELWECVQFSKVWAQIWRPTRTVVFCSTGDGCMCACTLRGRPPLLQPPLSDICVFRSGSALPELLCSRHLLWLLKPDPYVCWCMEAKGCVLQSASAEHNTEVCFTAPHPSFIDPPLLQPRLRALTECN